MFKHACHLPAVITKQKEHGISESDVPHVQTDMSFTSYDYKTKSMKCQKEMYHVQTDMSFTSCEYKTKQHGMSETDVPCSNRHITYIL
jgi:hypothetical protein